MDRTGAKQSVVLPIVSGVTILLVTPLTVTPLTYFNKINECSLPEAMLKKIHAWEHWGRLSLYPLAKD